MDIIIIGAGLSGLTAAIHLYQKGHNVKIIEATDKVGGRVKTYEQDGFLMDHGFQVLQTAYPEAQALLDYEALQLKNFMPGALILHEDGTKSTIGDPLRQFNTLLPTLRSNAGNFKDKLKILSLKTAVSGTKIDSIFQRNAVSTVVALKEEYGFSDQMINQFFKPFFSGIFLENDLKTSRRMFDFVFKMFSEGYAALPANGMEAIPKQLADKLPPKTIIVNQKVVSVDEGIIKTEDGHQFKADKILIATAAKDLFSKYKKQKSNSYQSVTNIYFSAPKSPMKKPIIGLNTSKNKLVNNICVMNEVAPNYAPKGKSLISVSINGLVQENDAAIAQKVKKEMKRWFSSQTEKWDLLKIFKIDYALPNQQTVSNQITEKDIKIGDNIYACGDHLLYGSINAAMKSGRVAAEIIGS